MKYWTYSTEWSEVEEIGLLFKTIKEAKDHSLQNFINQGLNKQDWEELTFYHEFKLKE